MKLHAIVSSGLLKNPFNLDTMWQMCVVRNTSYASPAFSARANAQQSLWPRKSDLGSWSAQMQKLKKWSRLSRKVLGSTVDYAVLYGCDGCTSVCRWLTFSFLDFWQGHHLPIHLMHLALTLGWVFVWEDLNTPNDQLSNTYQQFNSERMPDTKHAFSLCLHAFFWIISRIKTIETSHWKIIS